MIRRVRSPMRFNAAFPSGFGAGRGFFVLAIGCPRLYGNIFSMVAISTLHASQTPSSRAQGGMALPLGRAVLETAALWACLTRRALKPLLQLGNSLFQCLYFLRRFHYVLPRWPLL